MLSELGRGLGPPCPYLITALNWGDKLLHSLLAVSKTVDRNINKRLDNISVQSFMYKTIITNSSTQKPLAILLGLQT